MWVAGGIAAVALPVLFLMRTSRLPAPIVSPLAENTEGSGLAGIKGLTPSLYSPSQYIYLSQSYFADGQTMSQNREQSEEDKKIILAKLQQSLDTIGEGIAQYPKRPELWAHRAAIKRALAGLSANAIPSAIADMEQAVALSPANPDYTKTLSDLYLAQCKSPSGDANTCRLDQAVVYLTRTQTAKPNDAQLLYSLAQLQVKAGLLKSAQISFAKLLPLVSDAGQKQQVTREKTAVEQLLAKAGETKFDQLDKLDQFDQNQSPPPAGLELLPDQQVMSRELVVAAPDDGLSPYEDTVGSSAFSGSTTIPKGQTSVTVESTRVTDTAPVYVTPQGATNATLTVTTKKAGSHFVVSVDSPQTADLPFSWWILSP